MEKVIVFGHGRYYQSKKEEIKSMYQIMAFLDNAVKPEDTQFDAGIPILNPKNLANIPEYPVITMSANFFEMCEQLIRLGIEENRIRFGVMLKPYYDKVEHLFADLNVDIRVENGEFVLAYSGKTFEFQDEGSYKAIIRRLLKEHNPYIRLIADMPSEPVSRRFGLEQGMAIDRFYIEQFLSDNKKYIKGTVMEIAENRYTKMFGENILESLVLHVGGWGEGVVKGNLETGEGLMENSVDCLICTQTLQFIYDIHSTVKNIYKILKPGGTAMVTVSAISHISMYDYKNWGDYWRFTDMSIQQLFSEIFCENLVKVYTYGNMKASIAFLYGICQEEMELKDLEYRDEQYPMIITVTARKEY